MGLRPRLRKPDAEAGLSPLRLPYGGSYHELLWSGQPFERLLPARPAPLDSGDAGDDAGGGLDVLRQALAAPIGTPPLHELARGRRSAAVLIPGKARRGVQGDDSRSRRVRHHPREPPPDARRRG